LAKKYLEKRENNAKTYEIRKGVFLGEGKPLNARGKEKGFQAIGGREEKPFPWGKTQC